MRFHAIPLFYHRNRLSAYKIRFTSRCSTILHPNLLPQGRAAMGILGEKQKKPPNGWTFCAFAPLPGCVWSSPFCPPAEVSGREVAGRGSGRGKSTQLPGCDQIPFLRFLERVRENFLARSFPAQPHSFQKSPRRMAGAVLFDSVYFPTHRVRR